MEPVRTKLFSPLEAFKIPGRGTVICADFEASWGSFWIGDTIEIAFPSGTLLRTKIIGCDLFRGTFGRKAGGILIQEELPAEAVESAEVFKVSDAQAPRA